MSKFLTSVLSTVPASHSVSYSCTFTNNWSADNHSKYPGSAHWSPPVIAAHGKKYSMWEPGVLATKGVENVAETGSTSKLIDEIEDAQEDDFVGEYVKGGVTFNSDTQSQIFDDIVLTPWFNTMSSITMIAPSPDWYTGFYDIKPIDKSSDVWYQSFKVETFPWDAGTVELPQRDIIELTKNTIPENGSLLNPDGGKVLPMATWSCNLVSESCSDHDNVAVKGNSKKDCDWAGKPSKQKKKDKRCKKKYLGRKLASAWCPQACGTC
jgi:hypothetical protein